MRVCVRALSIPVYPKSVAEVAHYVQVSRIDVERKEAIEADTRVSLLHHLPCQTTRSPALISPALDIFTLHP